VSQASPPKVDRRSLLFGAVLLLGGAAALTRFGRGAGPSSARASGLSAEQFLVLEQVCETMIPTTDTPGAIAAGVPAFIRDMLGEWASPASRAEVIGVLEAIDQRAWRRYGAPFVEITIERRLEVVSAFDAEQIGRADRAYGKFKALVLVGYYHSEIGATQELRFELVPGAWRSCVPLSEIGRASAV
jgi:gluconate 2-dehydrogenase gamma chain